MKLQVLAMEIEICAVGDCISWVSGSDSELIRLVFFFFFSLFTSLFCNANLGQLPGKDINNKQTYQNSFFFFA